VILLNKAATSITKHNKCGLLRDTEATEYLEYIDDAVRAIHACTQSHGDYKDDNHNGNDETDKHKV